MSGARWAHNQDLNFENVRKVLTVAKAGVEQAIAECESMVKKKRAELGRMRGGR